MLLVAPLDQKTNILILRSRMARYQAAAFEAQRQSSSPANVRCLTEIIG
jgi:hypothetical protein